MWIYMIYHLTTSLQVSFLVFYKFVFTKYCFKSNRSCSFILQFIRPLSIVDVQKFIRSQSYWWSQISNNSWILVSIQNVFQIWNAYRQLSNGNLANWWFWVTNYERTISRWIWPYKLHVIIPLRVWRMRITPTVMENLLTNKICVLHTISETYVLTHCTQLQSCGGWKKCSFDCPLYVHT